MGCVSFAQLYFHGGVINKENFQRARMAAAQKTGNVNLAISNSGLERGNGRFRYHKSRP
ncbi:hypothetical protein ACLK1Z_14460 [Escherichia coli]